MTTVHDVPAEDLIDRLQEELEGFEEVEPPEWARYAKTGADRELPPEEDDWWYRRAASVLRRIYVEGPVGVSSLKKHYGGLDRRGSNPAHQKDGSGSVIRTVIHQLEDEELVEQAGGEGRRVTPEGQALLDDLAADAAEEIPGLDRY